MTESLPIIIMSKPKILVILGPTATGKSSLAVKVARKFNGEIISADSRQVYKGLDIGTGKITEEEMGGIPHHLLDVVEPGTEFSVAEYKKLAEEKIEEILSKGNLPILVGGTGFYIQSIVDGLVLPEVPPNEKLRKELEEKPVDELFEILKRFDLERATAIYGSNNKRRIIRAIEITTALGKVPELKKDPKYNTLQIGLGIRDQINQNERGSTSFILKKRIHDRLVERIETGMIEEGERLEKEIGLDRMIQLGLEYKYLALYLKGDLEKEEMIEKLEIAIGQYAKRQRTWFKRDERIFWFEPNKKEKIFDLIEGFLH